MRITNTRSVIKNKEIVVTKVLFRKIKVTGSLEKRYIDRDISFLSFCSNIAGICPLEDSLARSV